MRSEIVVIGGGIVGCATAAILADRGARVTLVEGSAIGAGASGRNLGAIQHPFDSALAPLYRESLSRYRALADATRDFTIDDEARGLLLLNRDFEAAAEQALRHRGAFPELAPTLLSPDELVEVEPSLRHGPAAVRLTTGHPIPPASATAAWARVADDRGARMVVGSTASPVIEGDSAVGVRLTDGPILPADAVLVAAGPWTAALVDPSGAWAPIRATWGVTLQLRLDGEVPRHIIEEDAGDSINRAAAATDRAGRETSGEPPSLFSIASAEGISTLGSTFLPVEPDPAPIASLLLRRGIAFLPALERAEIMARRLCARPQSADGRPFIGKVAGVRGLFVCAGHGPWGISTGPASAAIVARAILDGTPPPPELDANRRL